jgi:menaquinone-dependent protoporphyrinogen oxidase
MSIVSSRVSGGDLGAACDEIVRPDARGGIGEDAGPDTDNPQRDAGPARLAGGVSRPSVGGMTRPSDRSPNRVLVVVASRHGATREIADAVAGVLRAAGLEVDLEYAEGGAADPAGYDALVLGSAVYYGTWLPSARDFARRHAPALADRPVWLFSSGPVGEPRTPKGGGLEEREIVPGARDHAVFGGRIDRRLLGMRERAVTRVVGAGEGDFRDWADITSWAAAIADELLVGAAR